MNKPRLLYFHQDEFRGWFERMDTRHLVLIDALRGVWGMRIRVSPAEGAIGREAGAGTSYHNFARYGLVRACDYFPDGLLCREDVIRFVGLARDIGFAGIGVYPHWHIDGKQQAGIHLDTRPAARGELALWGAINSPVGKQAYVSYREALEAIA